MQTDDLTQLWIKGLALGDAWFLLGETAHKEQYRNAGRNSQLTHLLKTTMQNDLLGLLLHSEIQAVGVRVEPTVGAGPELVPVHLFADRPRVDWDTSEVRAAGQRYESIRVILDEGLRARIFPGARSLRQQSTDAEFVDPRELEVEAFDAGDPEPSLIFENASDDEVAGGVERDAPSSKQPTDRSSHIGRPSNLAELTEVISQLDKAGSLLLLPKKEQVIRIQEHARSKYPRVFTGKGSPSLPSINRALKQLGLQRASEKK